LGFGGRWVDFACEATFFSRRATSPSSSAIRAAEDLASRVASRPLARSAALARSSFSTCPRNSSLLSFGVALALAGAGARPLAIVFAGVAAGRPGLLPLGVRCAVPADLGLRGIALISSGRTGRVDSGAGRRAPRPGVIALR